MATNIVGATGIDKVQDGIIVNADIDTVDASKLTGTVADARISALTASKLTGALPAISGANLTGLSTFDPDGAVTINDTGADVDFRVESDTDANALFVQGSDSKVGINTATPNAVLHIGDSSAEGSQTNPALQIGRSGGSANSYRLGFYTTSEGGHIENKNGDDGLNFKVKTSGQVLQLTTDGRGLSQFTAKAWCAWDATGTPAITDSHNVSSLTDSGTGEQKLNFTNNLATADAYTVSALASKGGGAPSSSNNATCTIGSSLPVTGPYIGVIFNGSASDRDYVCATCFGD